MERTEDLARLLLASSPCKIQVNLLTGFSFCVTQNLVQSIYLLIIDQKIIVELRYYIIFNINVKTASELI